MLKSIAWLLVLLLLCSCKESTDSEPLAWNTPIEKVEQAVHLKLMEKTQNELKYDAPTDIGEKAQIYYSFGKHHGGLQAITTIIDFKYNAEVDRQTRLKNLNQVYEQYKSRYGEGIYTKDQEFEGYSWKLKDKLVRVVLSEGTPKSVWVIFFSPDYVKAIHTDKQAD